MHFSKLFVKPQKGVPAEATFESHKLLHKAGFIRQISAGRYALMPLGQKVVDKIVGIIDEEMMVLGSQKITTPTLQPIEIWQKTNRDQAFGDEMLLIKDHHGATFALGATAEGLMTDLVKDAQPTYKELPIKIHQFSDKFRDEKRPRGGLIRVREFLMKDAYSFHASEEDLRSCYAEYQQTYEKIAKRLGLVVLAVEADSGALGGDFNHEYMVLTESGEDTVVYCPETGYAANLERAESRFETFPQEKDLKPVAEFQHDSAVTCEDLAKAMGISLPVTTKTILFMSEVGPVAAMIRGDYDINETKLKKQLAVSSLRLATAEEIRELTGAEVGFMGPVGLPENVRLMADLTCEGRTNFEAGGNRTGIHLYHLNFERDFPTPQFADIRKVAEGDSVKEGEGKLVFKRAIEWGHTFHQGQFYSLPHEATFVDEKGQRRTLWQGAYGIGIGRSLATLVEVHHDEKGIIWPKSVAPFQVHLVMLGESDKSEGQHEQKIGKPDSSDPFEVAEKLYHDLTAQGWEVLWDERAVSPGVKFADMDLLGIPLRIVVSSRSLAGGGVEVSERTGAQHGVLSPTQVADLVSSFYTDVQ